MQIFDDAGNIISTHAPAGGATRPGERGVDDGKNFYSRPCGRGDRLAHRTQPPGRISTHAPAGGATIAGDRIVSSNIAFLLTPLREGRPGPSRLTGSGFGNFYSRPCGRGDVADRDAGAACFQFLLTPLREGRRSLRSCPGIFFHISTHAPAGGATRVVVIRSQLAHISTHAPAGGATALPAKPYAAISISTHAPAGGATRPALSPSRTENISTHAPAGGATAIFHKSVMRFCGKLPKDDTVLCLASFGFPRRDPKAVYLAWISCANLPQKCVREGLALKDQGTSCFHEGLASHAFDPVLV